MMVVTLSGGVSREKKERQRKGASFGVLPSRRIVGAASSSRAGGEPSARTSVSHAVSRAPVCGSGRSGLEHGSPQRRTAWTERRAQDRYCFCEEWFREAILSRRVVSHSLSRPCPDLVERRERDRAQRERRGRDDEEAAQHVARPAVGRLEPLNVRAVLRLRLEPRRAVPEKWVEETNTTTTAGREGGAVTNHRNKGEWRRHRKSSETKLAMHTHARVALVSDAAVARALGGGSRRVVCHRRDDDAPGLAPSGRGDCLGRSDRSAGSRHSLGSERRIATHS